VTAGEHPEREGAIARVADHVSRHADLDELLAIARTAAPAEFPDRAPVASGSPARVAVFRDESLSFYYPENLEALEEAGAELEFVSPLSGADLPESDAAYIGGGFPESHVERLADNGVLRNGLRKAAADGLPVYAECGGLMYLGNELVVGERRFPMSGVLDLTVEQTARPVGHGYAVGEVDAANPYFEPGTRLTGHEFHYSRVVGGGDRQATALRLDRGAGVADGRDAISVGRVWASYVHLHGLGTPAWAPAVMALARARRQERLGASAA
jgi:cobyrinic acid a,c-diamide synthase